MSRIFKALERAETEGQRASRPAEAPPARASDPEGKQASPPAEARPARGSDPEGEQASPPAEARPARVSDPEGKQASPPAEARPARVSDPVRRQASPPASSRRARVSDPVPSLELPEPHDEYAHIKVMLGLAANGSDQRSVMFVSALPREGVSTITLGFACAAVEAAPQGVLVVDVNFARPALAARLGVTARAGLSELLAKEISRTDAVVATPVQRLFLLGPGRKPVDLSQPRTRAVLDEVFADLRTAFDYVVLDGGSLRGSLESLYLASRVDAVTVVIQAERTGMDTARDAILQLRKAKANVVGTVLNRHREYLPSFLARRL
jgi:Mrp family chromosome partitioning ATPase